MTNNECIEAFRNGDQNVISTFYAKRRSVFLHDIGCFFHIKNNELLSEIFQETVIRLWKNITGNKLSEEHLSTTLAGYLVSIGRNVAMEMFRREGIRYAATVEGGENDNFPTVVSSGTLWQDSEQEVAVRKAVYAIGKPCAPLLLMFYVVMLNDALLSMRDNKWVEASATLDVVLDQTTDSQDEQMVEMHYNAEWLKVICLMHNGNVFKAKNLLRKIANSESPYSMQASELLNSF